MYFIIGTEKVKARKRPYRKIVSIWAAQSVIGKDNLPNGFIDNINPSFYHDGIDTIFINNGQFNRSLTIGDVMIDEEFKFLIHLLNEARQRLLDLTLKVNTLKTWVGREEFRI